MKRIFFSTFVAFCVMISSQMTMAGDSSSGLLMRDSMGSCESKSTMERMQSMNQMESHRSNSMASCESSMRMDSMVCDAMAQVSENSGAMEAMRMQSMNQMESRRSNSMASFESSMRMESMVCDAMAQVSENSGAMEAMRMQCMQNELRGASMVVSNREMERSMDMIHFSERLMVSNSSLN